MPLSFKDFTELLRGLPKDADEATVNQAAQHAEAGTPLQKIWDWANKPLVGSPDSPILAHTHSDDESTIRRVAEDVGSSLTSPVSLGTTALGVGAAAAGAKGMLGISRAARVGEALLQAPMAAEGAKQIVEGDSVGAKLGGVLQAGLAAHGVSNAMTHAFDPKAVVGTYMKEKGLTPRVREGYDPAAAMKTADAYEAMPHTPNDPAVKGSYSALKTQIDDQHKFLAERAGVKVEPWTGEGEPYKSSAEMQADVVKNNHLFFLPTDAGVNAHQLPLDHPMAEETVAGLTNDKFRAVHDYFGHAVEGNQFGPKGEQAAFNAHRDTLTDSAIPALATETKGQNSWVNSGKHLRNAEGVVPKKGEPGYVPLTERPFAQQKAGLLPEYQNREVLPQGDELVRDFGATSRKPAIGASLLPQPSAVPSLELSPELLADVNSRHLSSGGSTTNIVEGRGLTPQDARYALSPFEDRQVILDHPPTERELRNYIATNEDLLSKPGHNLGTWDNNGKHYLDVSIGENDLDSALALAKQHNQLAIFDMVNGKDVRVPSVDHAAAEASNIARNAPYGEGSIMPSAMKPTELSDEEIRAILTDKPTKQTIQKAETKTGKKFSAKALTNLLRKAR